MSSVPLTKNYDNIIDAANAYYGADYWNERYNSYISQGMDAGQTIQDMYNELESAGEITAYRNQNGDVVMWYSNREMSYQTGLPDGYGLNSNVGGGTASQQNTASINVPMQTEKNPTTGKLETKPVQTFTNGVADANSLKMVAGNVVQAIGAVASGISIGKQIDQRLYDANPDFWNSIGLETLNPQTWKSLTSDMGPAGKTAVNFLLGFKDDNTAQPYMNDQLFAYYMYAMANAGVFNNESHYTPPANKHALQNIDYSYYEASIGTQYQGNMANRWIALYEANAPVYIGAFLRTNAADRYPDCIMSSERPFKVSKYSGAIDSATSTRIYKAAEGINTYIYVYTFQTRPDNASWSPNYVQLPINYYTSADSYDKDWIAYDMLHGTEQSAVDGVSDQPGATLPNISGWDSPENTLTSLQNQYPDLWNNRAEQNVYDPDTDTTKKITYIPVGFPNGGTGDQPTNDPSKQGGSQSQPTINPDPNVPNNTPDPTILTLILSLTDRLENALKNPTPMTNPEVEPSPDNPVPDGDITLNPDPNPPDTGNGSTPTLILPTGNASSLWKVYHPTQAEVDAFGAWLWSSNFVEQIKKMFNDPMQSIIGLHKIFASPIDAGTATIKVGYLDSQVSSAYVNDQYVTVDCGSVSLREYFGNVFDYAPYTKVAIFLPFIGIQKLDVAEVMRSTISVVYHVDVFSGACLAEVSVTRDGGGGCLYTFSGDASARYPISSGSYMGIVSGVLSIAGGIAGTIATGGAALPALMGAGAAATHMHTDVSHSGQISGNAGAMGGKVPYLIVVRPQTEVADKSEKYYGYGANSYCKVESLSGFARLYNAVVRPNDSITDEERKEIQTILESGFYT